MRLEPAVYSNYYKEYIDKVVDKNWDLALEEEGHSMKEFINEIAEDKGDFRYAADKWTVKEVLMHLLDCERIMAYRALTFARGDQTDLPGFDENHYGTSSNASRSTLEQIENAYLAQRRSTILMFKSFSEEMMDLQGTANGVILSPRALAYIIAGHAYHHRVVLKERYL